MNCRFKLDYEDGETEWTKIPGDGVEILPRPAKLPRDTDDADPSVSARDHERDKVRQLRTSL